MLISKYTYSVKILFPGLLSQSRSFFWDVSLRSLPYTIKNLLYLLRNTTTARYLSLCDMVALDFLALTERFHVIYNDLSTKFKTRVFLRVPATEKGFVLSSSDVFSSAT